MTRPQQEAHADPATGSGGGPVLKVDGLRVSYGDPETAAPVLRDVKLQVQRGEIVGIVGESGSGKSTLALSISRLVEHVGGSIHPSSSIVVCGRDVTGASASELRDIRRSNVSMIFQDPLSSLNPVQTVGKQIIEALRLRYPSVGRHEARDRAIELISSTGIRQPEARVDSYPHALSGGMRQRIMIAIALASEPALIIADEPTTALDVTVKRAVLDLLRDVVDKQAVGLVLVTHDMSTIRAYADRTAVMYAGRVVELADTATVHEHASHPYSSALIAAVPRLEDGVGQPLTTIPGAPPELNDLPTGCSYHPRCPRSDGELCVTVDPESRSHGDAWRVACHYPGPLTPDERRVPDVRVQQERLVSSGDRADPPELIVEDLHKRYRLGRRGVGSPRWVDAVGGVSFSVRSSETFGLVGESGSGKTTVARCIGMLTTPTSGQVQFGGQDLTQLGARQMRRLRRHIQVVFQNPGASLDPRWKIRDLIREPMQAHDLWGSAPYDEDRVDTLLERVGLSPADGEHYPHEFSGGQRQRIAIARALSVDPQLLILDEPVSSLDVSIRAGIIELLRQLQSDLGMSYLFIAHDLPLVSSFCDRVAVMQQGRIVECGPTSEVLINPEHEYTQGLLSAEL